MFHSFSVMPASCSYGPEALGKSNPLKFIVLFSHSSPHFHANYPLTSSPVSYSPHVLSHSSPESHLVVPLSPASAPPLLPQPIGPQFCCCTLCYPIYIPGPSIVLGSLSLIAFCVWSVKPHRNTTQRTPPVIINFVDPQKIQHSVWVFGVPWAISFCGIDAFGKAGVSAAPALHALDLRWTNRYLKSQIIRNNVPSKYLAPEMGGLQVTLAGFESTFTEIDAVFWQYNMLGVSLSVLCASSWSAEEELTAARNAGRGRGRLAIAAHILIWSLQQPQDSGHHFQNAKILLFKIQADAGLCEL